MAEASPRSTSLPEDNGKAKSATPPARRSPSVPEDGPAFVAVDEDLDNDSAYADDKYGQFPPQDGPLLNGLTLSSSETFTTSLKSSIYNYPERYGRRYHAFREGRHFLPNDERERVRHDIHHTLISVLLNERLFFAPFNPENARTLDLGTGWGHWAIDFADAFPSAHVIGNDLSPVQPQMVPPNLQFIIEDFEDEWDYEDNPFDFVHGRYLGGAVRDWPRLMRLAYKNIKPGGWVEFQDWDTMVDSFDGTVTEDTWLWKWHKIGLDRIGQIATLRPGPYLEEWITAAGFRNVGVETFVIPLGTWPKDKHLKLVGSLNRLQMEEGLESISIGTYGRPVGNEPAWSMEEIQVMIAHVRADMRNRELHGLHKFYVVYGQKPYDS